MRVLIIEDEPPALKRLTKMLKASGREIELVDSLDSVESSVSFLKNFKDIDLIFMDIQLGDGISFDIFSQVELNTPVIFTTAYNQYMMNAFKVNSVDYLLKPIDGDELNQALEKFENLHLKKVKYDPNEFKSLLENLIQKEYKSRFLVKSGNQLQYINTSDVQYFYFEDGYVHLVDSDKKKHIIDHSIEQLKNLLDPKSFFRINRKMILDICSIQKISPYFNGRMKLQLNPKFSEDVIVSRERVSDFKAWLNQ